MAIWTGREIAERRRFLTEGLTQRPGQPPGALVHRTLPEIAAALSQQFRRPISASTAQRLVQDAMAFALGETFLLRKRGRPRAADGAASGSAPALQATPRRQASIAMRTTIAQALYELCVLTGMTAASLHELLAITFEDQAWLWKKAAFHAHLSALLSERVRNAKWPEQADFEPAHMLRIHQVNFRGFGSSWVTVLLAFDLDTQFVNVAVFEIHGDPWHADARNGAIKSSRRGPRPKLPPPAGEAMFLPPPSHQRIQLSSELVLRFAEDTQSKMALPVGTLVLCRSLGDVDRLCRELATSQPGGCFEPDAGTYQQVISVDAWLASQASFSWRSLATLINQHNAKVADSNLQMRRRQLDEREKAAPQRKGIRRVNLRRIGQRPPLPSEDEVELAKAIQDFKKAHVLNPHRGRFISIRPMRIDGSVPGHSSN